MKELKKIENKLKDLNKWEAENSVVPVDNEYKFKYEAEYNYDNVRKEEAALNEAALKIKTLLNEFNKNISKKSPIL